jgi:3-oxoacyl-(acyl-carrier-protein) synthase III
VAILGLGVYRPVRVVSNDEICGPIDSSDEWIRSRSGIGTRRFAGPDETVISMSVAAARQALERSGIAAEQIGCVVLATSTYLSQTPAAAPQIAHLLGADAPAAFDISAGCAGFCHAVSLAADMVRGGSALYVLVIGTEKLSETLDLTDRSTAFIFADGAGAVIVGPSDVEGIGPVVWGSDGSQADVIRQEPDWSQFRNDPSVGTPYVRMEGTKVFRWAPFAMVKVATEALDRAGIAVGDLGAFIPHQANLRITETLARGLKIPESVPVARDIIDSGNTSAASVPLAMEAMLAGGHVAEGATALLIAFGAGLSFAAQVVTLPSCDPLAS